MLENCRICLKKETELILTSTMIENKNITYNEKLNFCVPEINWSCEDRPSFICYNCVKQLETAADFRRLCLKSEITRKQYIERYCTKPDTSDSRTTIVIYSSKKNCSDNEEDDDEYKDECDILSDNETEIAQNTANKATNERFIEIEHEEQNSYLKSNTLERNKIINHGDKSNTKYVPNRKKHPCKFCNSIFSKYSTLVNHIRSIHTLEKLFKCEICGEAFTNLEILSRHKNRHTDERKYVCCYCGKKYLSNSDLNHHVQRHQNKRNYKCDVCKNKSFNTANCLRTHKLVVHTNSDEWKYLCTICGRKCVTQSALTVHIKRHSQEKDFTCHLCSKRFCTKSELNRHIPSHSNMRLHKCNICNQEYKNKNIMEMHLARKHGVGNAKVSVRVKKYFCDLCPRSFVGKKQLEKHIRAHNGEKPFKCDLCGQAFVCNSYIKGHMKSKHLLETKTDD